MNYLEQMGIVGYLLLACSIISLAVILERLIFFLYNHPISEKWIIGLLQLQTHALPEDLTQELQHKRFGRIILELFSQRTMDPEERESLLSLRLLEVQSELSRYLQLLKILASISPLLGLLGTILGMIRSFDAIAQVQGPITPSVIASGISQAMLTTAAGLLIAIPSLLAYSLFQMRAASLMNSLTRQLNLLNQHIKHRG
ncbi:MAG: MotA/TolQ/ExbB proton channel family protein [SAR324 cluster bacterium]|nr:MotA/TolQ/ExbB proton channel family protein [SAR324 cluster bacterium]